MPRHLCKPPRANPPAPSGSAAAPLPARGAAAASLPRDPTGQHRPRPPARPPPPRGQTLLRLPQNVPKLSQMSPKPRTAGKPPLLGRRCPDGPVPAHPRCRGWPAGSGARRTAAAAGGTSSREPAPRRGRPSRHRPAAPSRRPSAHGAAAAAPPRRCPLGSAQDGTGLATQLHSAPLQPPARLGSWGAGTGEVAPRRHGDAPDGADPPQPPPPSRAGAGARRVSGSPRGAAGAAPKMAAPRGNPPPGAALPVGEGRWQRCPCQASLGPRPARGAGTGSSGAPWVLPAAATVHSPKKSRPPAHRAGEAAVSRAR